jgi:hypothetical protein
MWYCVDVDVNFIYFSYLQEQQEIDCLILVS